jgi:hypothetical protein
MSKTKRESNPSQVKRIRWVFRCNADPEATTEDTQEIDACRLIGDLIDHSDKFVFQLESAPTTGYLHHQGYFELKNKKAFTWIQKNIRKFEFLSPAKGTPKQAWHYNTKQDSRVAGPWHLGEPTAAESGAQQKTELFVKAVQAGHSRSQLLDEHPSCYARHNKLVDHIRHIKYADRPPTRMELYGDEHIEVYVLFGEPGTGKSRAVRALYPDVYVVPIQNKSSFFLTERGNLAREVLIEDFDGNMPLKDFNQRLDLYPIEAQIKNGFIWWLPKIIFLTTNTPPALWYNYSARQNVKAQVYRRITYCFDFNTPEGVVMTKGMSCQELEDKYKPPLTMLQDAANKRMILAPKYKPQWSREQMDIDGYSKPL